MKALKLFKFVFILLFFVQETIAQIPFGRWRLHPNFSDPKGLEAAETSLFSWSSNGFFSYNTVNSESQILSKIDGFSDNIPSVLKYLKVKEKSLLLVGYTSGKLDIAELDTKQEIIKITPFEDLFSSTSLGTDRQINAINAFSDSQIALATNVGIIILDPIRLEIIDFYRLFANNQDLPVLDVLLQNNIIYALTTDNVFAGKMAPTTNLNDFSSWQPTNFKFPLAATLQTKRIGNTDYSIETAKGFFKTQAGRKTKFSPQSLELSIDFLGSTQGQVVVQSGNLFQTFKDQTWQNTNLTFSSKRLTDALGNLWTISFGDVVVLEKQTQRERRFASYNTPNISGEAISLCFNRDGKLFIGTTNGLSILENPTEVFSSNPQIYQPEAGNRRLFFQDRVLAMAADVANRMWFATPNGVFLLDKNFQNILSFNATNSPLGKELVTDLGIDDASGEVFFKNGSLVLSYRSDATTAPETLDSQFIIAPNPVQPGYDGPVIVSNLPANTKVSFSDLSGRIIFETTSNGGSASWNLIDQFGQPVQMGIYLVFLTDEPNGKRLVGKLGVVR